MENKKMNKRIKIFLDLDGCISDWLGNGCKTCGVDATDPVIRNQLKDGVWLDDIIDKEVMWDTINSRTHTWWMELELLPWAKKLVETLRPLGDFAFLTSPGDMVKHPITAANAAYGKVLWCNEHFKGIPLIISHSKHLNANENSILIDDSKLKIDNFMLYGGRTFTWPNQYRFIDGELNVDEYLEELVYQIKMMKHQIADK